MEKDIKVGRLFTCWCPQMGKPSYALDCIANDPRFGKRQLCCSHNGEGKSRFGSMCSAGLRSDSNENVDHLAREAPWTSSSLAKGEEKLGWVIGNGRHCVVAAALRSTAVMGIIPLPTNFSFVSFLRKRDQPESLGSCTQVE